ncbi:class I SAM-dependent DNA methyltransferase [Aliihoeflea sp. PC F10.4]
MTDAGKARGLDKVYGASDAAELATAYAAWAAEYDRDTIGLGYCLPFVIAGWVGRYARPGAALLDVGCGTGLSGPVLHAMGHDDLTGLDMSPHMLEIAATRGAYSSLVEGQLGERLPFEDGRFDLCLASGVFTCGHAPAIGLEEIVRITKPGGHVVATIRDLLMESEFRPVIDRLTEAGRCETIEESPYFRPFVLGEDDARTSVVVLRKR